MAKVHHTFHCQNCLARFPKWLGRCTECHAWHSIVETPPPDPRFGAPAAKGGRGPGIAEGPAAVPLADVGSDEAGERMPTGLPELERVLGGGLLAGSAVLLGGDPGIGKSTLVLQLAAHLAASGRTVLYISAEESAAQVKSRAARLKVNAPSLHLLPEVDLERILPEVQRLEPALVIVDSIQTVRHGALDALAGNVSQVRACTQALVQLAKTRGPAVLLVGHVTKDGALAGPRTLEHMVDVVLYLEGQSERPQRLLRSVKNRFGAVHEIGLFQMEATGLNALLNPSALFLQERVPDAPGTVVFPGLEGSRPLLVELQALVAEGGPGYARPTAVGLDPNRVALLRAVIEKHLGDGLTGFEVYLNVVGGLRMAEPAVDAAVVAALLSSFRNRALDPHTVVLGEVGLTGELRSVRGLLERLSEAARLGFTRALAPRPTSPLALPKGIALHPVGNLRDLAEALFP